MSKVICNTLYLSSTVISIISVLANSSLGADFSRSRTAANESNTLTQQYTPYQEKSDCYIPNTLTQVTPVSQLSDIKTTDWNFQALKSLNERYGVVADNDNTLWENQSLARCELATLLKATINRLNKLIAKENAELVRQEDLISIQRLKLSVTQFYDR
jgi:hypothetical protein